MSKTKRQEKSKSSKRKLEKRLQFHAKVKDATTSLSATKIIDKKKRRPGSRQRKLKVYDLSSLSEFLPDINAVKKPADTTSTKLNCKSRQKLVKKETALMNAVLNNPAFQLDPIASIQQHLENTQPPPNIDQRKKFSDKDKKEMKKAKKKNRKMRAKEASSLSPMSMEM